MEPKGTAHYFTAFPVSPPLISILTEINTVCVVPTDLFQINFNIIFPSYSRFYILEHQLQTLIKVTLKRHTFYVESLPSYASLFSPVFELPLVLSYIENAK